MLGCLQRKCHAQIMSEFISMKLQSQNLLICLRYVTGTRLVDDKIFITNVKQRSERTCLFFCIKNPVYTVLLIFMPCCYLLCTAVIKKNNCAYNNKVFLFQSFHSTVQEFAV